MFQSARRYLPSQASIEAARVASIEAARVASLKAAGARDKAIQHSKALLDAQQGRLLDLPKFELPDTSTVALLGTTFNLLNATTGPGLLALPLAFSRCGWLLGSVLLIIVFGLNYAALNLLLTACLTTREHSYMGLSLRHGPELAALVDWGSCLFFAGSCVSYLVIIGDTFGAFTSRWGDGPLYDGSDGPWYMHFSGLALIGLTLFTALVLAPLSTLRSMDSLQFTSAIAMVCILYAVAIIVLAPGTSAVASMAADQGTTLATATATATAAITATTSATATTTTALGSSGGAGGLLTTDQMAAIAAARATLALEDDEPQGARPVVLSSQTLLSLPTMAFCFASQPLFPPALETLHQPATYEHMTSVVQLTMGLTLIIHLLVALGGYMRFGAAVSPNVLDSLPQSPAVAAAQLCIVLAFAFTYPMMIFLCRMHLESALARHRSSPGGGGSSLGGDRSSLGGGGSSNLGGGVASSSVSSADAHAATPGTVPTPPKDHHLLMSLLLVGGTFVLAILFPNIDAIFGLLGGTTAVILSFIAPSLFWERFSGYMYPWRSPRKLLSKGLLAFAALVAALSLPSLLISLLGDLYATTWWVPMYGAAGFSHWEGGLRFEQALEARQESRGPSQ